MQRDLLQISAGAQSSTISFNGPGGHAKYDTESQPPFSKNTLHGSASEAVKTKHFVPGPPGDGHAAKEHPDRSVGVKNGTNQIQEVAQQNDSIIGSNDEVSNVSVYGGSNNAEAGGASKEKPKSWLSRLWLALLQLLHCGKRT